jgi:hypothetical protein
MHSGQASAERMRLDQDVRRDKNWKRWGPYLSERQWGTVREDYSALDSTPTHSYMKALYTYPQAEFPYAQLLLFVREWYMHPNGQLPAYEFDLSDVNPPVHASAARRVYKMCGPRGARDRLFLRRLFQKLLLTFTWWVNREDRGGDNLFSGGFLGLDNISVFDRSKPLPSGQRLEQADGTAWMAFCCGTLLSRATPAEVSEPAIRPGGRPSSPRACRIWHDGEPGRRPVIRRSRSRPHSGVWTLASGFFLESIRSFHHRRYRKLSPGKVSIFSNRAGDTVNVSISRGR